MEKEFRHSLVRMGIVWSAVVWATACSEVSFTPAGEIAESAHRPDGFEKEVFQFNGDETQAKVDVLFIVDNSTSMLDEQSKLANRFDSFIGMLGAINWQIGVTTTDISEGSYGIKGSLVPFHGTHTTIIDKHTPNAEDAFKNTIVREELKTCKDDTCPSKDERPLEATVLAIEKRNRENVGFFRSDSDFVVVILSDEDEGSNGTDAISPETVVGSFRAAFGESKRITAFAIVIEPGDRSCYDSQWENAGKYAHITSGLPEITGGLTGSICDDDYGPTLASIGKRVRESVYTLTLRNVPDPDSIQLRIHPFDPELRYEIDGQTIRFQRAPKKGTQIEVVYKKRGTRRRSR